MDLFPIENNDVRALLGSFSLVGGFVCFWFCVYKCILCLKEKEDRHTRITVIPNSEVTYMTTKTYHMGNNSLV